MLYEASQDSAQNGDAAAVKLLTAHSAKGLEFKHVIVMDCGDWRASDDDRRLLYVAMTRAKQSLTLFRIDNGRNTLLSDLSTVEGVQSLLPDLLPQHRPEIQRRYLTYGPKEVALSFAGKQPDGHSLHRHLRSLTVGSEVLLRNRFFYTTTGEVVGQLAKSVVDLPEGDARGIVKGVMVRLRSQSKPEYINMLKTDRWEVPLVEFISKSN